MAKRKKLRRASARSRFTTFVRVIFPSILPALLTGFALAFARAIGEYGSVVFIAGNMPMKTEITSLLIITKLEQFDIAAASALAVVMLLASFAVLLAINILQWRIGQALSGGVLAMSATLDRQTPSAVRDPLWLRTLMIGGTLLAAGSLLLLPLAVVFIEAFRDGWRGYLESFNDPYAWQAIQLTLIAAAICGAAELGVWIGGELGRSRSSISSARAF